MQAISLPSGHTLELGTPDWAPAKKLFKTLARELKGVDVDIEKLDLGKLLETDVLRFKDLVLQVLGSDALETCMFECAQQSLLEGQKITSQTFQNVDLRQDYLPVAWEVMKLTLTPFFASLRFALSTPAAPASPTNRA